MGTYYRYVNYTRKEFISLSDLRSGGDKENAALYCAPVITWLMLWPFSCGDGYRGRWHNTDKGENKIAIVSDAQFDFTDMADDGYLNISPGILQSLRHYEPMYVADYHPKHEITLSTRTLIPLLIWKLNDECSAKCSCGWQSGSIFGANREQTVEVIVSHHLED